MSSTKMKKETVDIGGGLVLHINRPFTAQDAIDDFKAKATKLGGKVTQVQDELEVSGLSADQVKNLSTELSEALKDVGKTVGDYSTIERRLAAHMILSNSLFDSIPYMRDFSPLHFGGFVHPNFQPGPKRTTAGESILSAVAKRARERLLKPAPKPRIADVAPAAMSTWEFSQEYLARVAGTKVNLVGQHYRPKRAQKVLGYKHAGNMALLVAEPDNPMDMNAIMVLMWEDESKTWQQVGYVRARQAALLRSKWKGDHRHPMVARITHYPQNSDGHREGNNIELTLTGEVRTYPGYILP